MRNCPTSGKPSPASNRRSGTLQSCTIALKVSVKSSPTIHSKVLELPRVAAIRRLLNLIATTTSCLTWATSKDSSTSHWMSETKLRTTSTQTLLHPCWISTKRWPSPIWRSKERSAWPTTRASTTSTRWEWESVPCLRSLRERQSRLWKKWELWSDNEKLVREWIW